MKYKVTLNGRTYEVEVEAGKAMLLAEYEAVAPAPEIQKVVMSIIYDEIKRGEQGSREKFLQIDRALRAMGCDCAILACTELSVFRTYHPMPSFYVDAMQVLADLSIVRCGKQLRSI